MLGRQYVRRIINTGKLWKQDSFNDAFRYWKTMSLNDKAAKYFESSPERMKVLEYVKKSKSTGANLLDYHLLHSYILQKKPNRIVEYGAGASTVLLAQALQEVHKKNPDRPAGHLVSYEENKFYFEDLKKLVPSELSSYVTLVLSEKEEVVWNSLFWGYRYKDVPKGKFDLAFVDGPSDSEGCRIAVFLDALYLLSEGEDQTMDIVIDRRITTCHCFQMVFPRKAVQYDSLNNLGVIRGASKQTLLKKPSRQQLLVHGSSWEALGLDEDFR